MCEKCKHLNKANYVEQYTAWLDKVITYCLDCNSIVSTQYIKAKDCPNYDLNS